MPNPSPPDAESLLRAIAATQGLWFAQQYADEQGLSRECLNEPLWLLRQMGLVEVGDWVKGRGQGLRLSDQGRETLAANRPVVSTPVPSSESLEVAAPRLSVPTELERGDAARNAVLDPAPAVLAPLLLYANLAWFIVGCIVAWRGGVAVEFLKGNGHPGAMTVLSKTGALTASAAWNGDWWRLASACFVHIGLFHLLCNTLTLGMMGPFAEGLWGRWRFATIYAVSGLCGSVSALALHPLASSGADVLCAGASGCLWGILTSVIVWLLRNRRHLPPDLSRDWGRRLLFGLVLNAAISFSPGVSAEAHFGGGIAGAIMAWCVSVGHRRPNLWVLGGIAGTLLLAAGLLAANVIWSEDWKRIRSRTQVMKMIEQELRRVESEIAEQAAVREAVKELAKSLSPKSLEEFRKSYEMESTFRRATPKAVPKKLGERAEELARKAASAADRAGDSTAGQHFREYCLAVKDYAEAIRNELAKPPSETSPEVDAAWNLVKRKLLALGAWVWN